MEDVVIDMVHEHSGRAFSGRCVRDGNLLRRGIITTPYSIVIGFLRHYVRIQDRFHRCLPSQHHGSYTLRQLRPHPPARLDIAFACLEVVSAPVLRLAPRWDGNDGKTLSADTFET